jgi:hypothetical protein
MKKLVILFVLALELAVCGCGSNNTSTTTSTSTAGKWEALLTGGTGQASLLNFVTSFSVTNSGPLNVTGFTFLNDGACFAKGLNGTTQSGSAALTTSTTNAVTGTLDLTINSVTPAGNTLKLTGALTGTSNGTTTTTGTLSNGVVVGTWTLTGSSDCTGGDTNQGSFTMCQNPMAGGTCPAPAS